MKLALITGITGQDGSYLAEFLLEKGYHVWGIQRRASSFNTERIAHIRSKITLKYGDLTDTTNLTSILLAIKPLVTTYLEIYNLAAQSHVKVSFELPEYTGQVDAIGTLRLLEAIRCTGISAKFYQACTSEMYGKVQEVPQKETTPFYPRSPYGVAKLYSFWITKNYRESYNMFACNGILFNHESPRRGPTFVTRKITKAVNAIVEGRQEKLILGNLNSQRDWGHARDYVKGMWMMLQQEKADDFVLATGEMHSVREFVELAFQEKDIKISWNGEGVNEIGVCGDKTLVEISEQYFRPAEVDQLMGDSTKAKKRLGWKPSIGFKELVSEMVKMDGIKD